MEASVRCGVCICDVLDLQCNFNKRLRRYLEFWMTRRIAFSNLYFGALSSMVIAALTLGSGASLAQESKLVRAAEIDIAAGTVTLPLQQGQMAGGETVWYVLLDASERETADRLGINFSDKLSNAATGAAVREAVMSPEGTVVFDVGAVDFAPVRMVAPGPADAPFPPKHAQPGSVGDEDYTPLMRVDANGGTIFNAPVLAFDIDADALNRFCEADADHALTHDKVVRICPRDGTVTMALTDGFAGGEVRRYVSTESNVALVAALEGATHAPRLGDVPADLSDSPWSAVEPIYVVINGDTGASAPARQGLTSPLADGLPPLNITGDVPGLGRGYSPLWASHPVVWNEGTKRQLLTSETQVRSAAKRGTVHGFDGDDVRADGILVNCPVISRGN